MELTASARRKTRPCTELPERCIASRDERRGPRHPGNTPSPVPGHLSTRQLCTRELRFVHEMINAETSEVVATSELTGVHFDRSARKHCELPSEMADRARALLRQVPA